MRMPIPVDLPEGLSQLLSKTQTDDTDSSLPHVTLAYAQSLDGSIAAYPGLPLTISGPASMEITHHLRARHQVIIVGVGTLLADDPRLNVRLVTGDDPQPVVLDNQLRFPLNARLLEGKKKPWIMTSKQASSHNAKALIQAGARLVYPSSGRIELIDVLKRLAQDGVGSVMVEGGAQVITAFLTSQLVDLLVVTLSPLMVGGLHAITQVLVDHPSARGSTSEFPRLDIQGVESFEDDLLIWGTPVWGLPHSIPGEK
jgi:3,4-dihydroxy 2-butanone 4-phosphate synthase/GTP cyclohydrolase II